MCNGCPGISSLDTSETIDDPLRVQSRWQYRMHSKHQSRREHIVRSLNFSPSDALRKRAKRMADCCQQPQLIELNNGRTAASLNRCKDRMCPLCAGFRAASVKERVATYLRTWRSCRLITLTVRSDDRGLAAQMKHLFDSFRKLRALRWWRESVQGGFYVVEVTLNQRTHQWHAHLHMLADGDFIAQAKLAHVWEQVTGDSRIVDIRAVPDRDKAVSYLTTYLAKPANVERWPPDAVREYAEALHGKRLVHTFGSHHAAKSDVAEEAEEPKPAAPLLSLSRLSLLDEADVADASHACEILARRGWPWTVLLDRPSTLNGASPPPIEEWEEKMLTDLLRSLSLQVAGETPARPQIQERPAKQGALFQLTHV